MEQTKDNKNLQDMTIRDLLICGMDYTSDDERSRIDFSQNRNYRNRWWVGFFEKNCNGLVRLDGKSRTRKELYQLRFPYIAEVKKRLEIHKVNYYTVKTYGTDQIKNILDLI